MCGCCCACVCVSVCMNKWKANNKLVHKYFGQTNNRSKMIPPQRFTPSKDPAQFQAETFYYVPHTYVVCTLCGSTSGRQMEAGAMCGPCPSGSTIVAVATAQKLQLHTHLPVLNCLTTNTKWPFSFIFMILPIPHMCGAPATPHPILQPPCAGHKKRANHSRNNEKFVGFVPRFHTTCLLLYLQQIFSVPQERSTKGVCVCCTVSQNKEENKNLSSINKLREPQ